MDSLEGVEYIIPLDVQDLESNIRNVKLTSFGRNQRFLQLKLYKNLRILTIERPQRMPTITEMEAIVSGCERIEKIHYELEVHMQKDYFKCRLIAPLPDRSKEPYRWDAKFKRSSN